MHIFCSRLHAAAAVCLLHQRLADAAAGADGAGGAVCPAVVVSVARPQPGPVLWAGTPGAESLPLSWPGLVCAPVQLVEAAVGGPVCQGLSP